MWHYAVYIEKVDIIIITKADIIKALMTDVKVVVAAAYRGFMKIKQRTS